MAASYFRPETLNEALSVLAGLPVRVAAGCTDLLAATDRPALGGPVLDLTAIAALRGVTRTPQGWRIGATTTWSDVQRAELPPAFDMLKQAAREVGSEQIQNAGTIAGNLCNASPAADGVPPLLALEASVEVASASGHEVLGLSDFVTGVRRTALRPGQIVTAVHIPQSAATGISRFIKLGARKYLVISIAMVAARVVVAGGRIDEAAIAVGACSAVATRMRRLEGALRGCAFADLAGRINADTVAPDLSPISDIRGDGAYRTGAAVELLRRALADLTGEPT